VCIGAENLGIEQLSAVLKQAGHDVKLIFDPGLFDDKYYFKVPILGKIFSQRKKVLARILDLKPDLLAFSVFTDNYFWALDYAKEAKKHLKIPIIFGGFHPTAVPERVLGDNDCVDIVCLSEGEEALLELVERMQKKEDYSNIKNLWIKKDGKIIKNPIRPLIADLDTLPFPDKELFADDVIIKGTYIIMASRGCPYGCTYCFNNFMRKLHHKDKYLRRRSIGNVIEELVKAKKRFNFKAVSFNDDIFTTDKIWLEKFLREYKKKIDVPFRAITHPNFCTSEIVSLLKDAGCYNLAIGVQSMNEDIRRNILKRYETNESIFKAMDVCNAIGITYTTDHIFGIPTETEKDYEYTLKQYIKYKPQRIACFWLSYFPKTEISNIAYKRGFLTGNDLENIEAGKEKMYHDKGSVKDRQFQKVCKNYDVFFKLIPVFPRPLLWFFYKTKIYKLFHFVPFFITLIIEVYSAISNKDYETLTYVKYYWLHIKKNLTK